MARPEKVQAVADIKERVEGAQAVFVTEYAGLKVGQQQELRRSLRSADAEFQVVKMTLARRAVGELGHDDLLELLSGPTGLAYAPNDPVPAAKALRDFHRANEALVIKGMLMAGRVLPPEQVEALAEIAPRDVLLAQLAGTMQAPLTAFVGVLSALIRNTAYGFQALLDQRIAAGEALESEAPAAVAAEDEPVEPDEPDEPVEPVATAADETEDDDAGDDAESPDSPDSPDSPESPDSPDTPDSPADDETADDETEATDEDPAPAAEEE